MQLNSALGVLGIAAVSAVAIFTVHRVLTTAGSMLEPPSTLITPLDARRTAQSAQAVDPPAADEPIPLVAEADLASAAQSGAEPGQPANPHIDALRHPSPVYRNVSLATVIRDAGHVCVEILSSASGDDELGAWRVACDGGHAYFVSPGEAGELHVEPMPYFEMPFRPPLREPVDRPLRLVPLPE